MRTASNLSMQGFGVTARSTAEARKMEPTGIVTFRQGDVGEYLREVRFLMSLPLTALLILNRKILFSPHEHRGHCSLSFHESPAVFAATREPHTPMPGKASDALAALGRGCSLATTSPWAFSLLVLMTLLKFLDSDCQICLWQSKSSMLRVRKDVDTSWRAPCTSVRSDKGYAENATTGQSFYFVICMVRGASHSALETYRIRICVSAMVVLPRLAEA